MLSVIGVASGFKFMSEVRTLLDCTFCVPSLLGSGGTLFECSIRILPAQAQGLALAQTKRLPLGSFISKFTELHRFHFYALEFALLLVLCCRCSLCWLACLPALFFISHACHQFKLPQFDKMVQGPSKFGDKKLAVITGTSSGLGKMTARALLRTGEWHVVGAVRDLDKMELVAEMEEFNLDVSGKERARPRSSSVRWGQSFGGRVTEIQRISSLFFSESNMAFSVPFILRSLASSFSIE